MLRQVSRLCWAHCVDMASLKCLLVGVPGVVLGWVRLHGGGLAAV
jgi:hypothetical protein